MKKITLKEFFENYDEMFIHCDTEEKANKLLKAFDKMGKTWHGGMSYLEDNNWDIYGQETVYSNRGTCCSVIYTKKYIKAPIFEFEEVDLETAYEKSERLEEELGIDPIKVIEAVKDGIYSREYKEKRKVELIHTSPSDNFKRTDYELQYEGLCLYDDVLGDYYYFVDYGKTWCLIGEKLEEVKEDDDEGDEGDEDA